MTAPIVVHVVPHTHWDREWYETFEANRFRLVKVVDRLLETLDTDPAFRHFHLDGQTAAIEDYLDIRPPVGPEIERFVSEGRLAVGPWRILMDEFLCSPETIVRNLQQGHDIATRLGRKMAIGYIPDSFGHIGQMPQLLRLAGMTDACVWRGVPAAIDRTTFTWRAPDGSEVRTLYLATSYGNAASLPSTVEDLLVRAQRIVSDLAPFEPGSVVLAMNGSDHAPADPALPELFAAANDSQDAFEFRIGSLEEYLGEAPAAARVWTGELRSGARANLLMGVASARMPLKQAELAASTMLERYAEPLSALAGSDTGRLLDRAWRQLVENSAHDSICGCGIDDVAEHVATRYREAGRVADLVAHDALQQLASQVDASAITDGGMGLVVFNPSPRPRDGVVEVTLPARGAADRLAFTAPDGSTHPAQVLSTEDLRVLDMTMRGSQLARIVPTVHSRMIGDLYVNGLAVERGRTTTVRIALGPTPEGRFDVEAAKRKIEEIIEEHPRGRFHVVADGPPLCRTLVRVSVPAMGWATLSPVDAGTVDIEHAARATGATLDNGLVRAEIDGTGKVALVHLASGARYDGLLAFEDGADAGDEYNYSPPERDLIVRDPDGDVVVDEIADGPLEATLRVSMSFRIPGALANDGKSRARRTVAMPVVLDVTLRAGEPFLRVSISLDNDAHDHRLRVRFPLSFDARGSYADGAFEIVERGLLAEGGEHEYALPTFPCRRWVDVNDGARGLAVFHLGTPEYEIVDGNTLAITLLRSVGWLSRQGMLYRAGGAGPALEAPGAQLRGPFRAQLAIYPHAGDHRSADVLGQMERFAYPMRALALHAHPGTLPAAGGALSLEPRSVQMSALIGDEAGYTLRVYNADDRPVSAAITVAPPITSTRAELVSLLGEAIAPLAIDDGMIRLPLRAWEIATIRLT